MTYAELRALIMDESHRADLTARVPGFVTRAEAMIARQLRAVEMIAQVTLTDSDRSAAESPIYDLPADFLEDRNVICSTETYPQALRKVARDSLLRTNSVGTVQVFHLRSSALKYQIEFRANPSADAEIELEYFARPTALSGDDDTNRLLELHESVYLHAALFALYSWTQDLELAQAALDTWTNAVNTLNEQAGRFMGGSGLTPTLNLGHYNIGKGY